MGEEALELQIEKLKVVAGETGGLECLQRKVKPSSRSRILLVLGEPARIRRLSLRLRTMVKE